MTRPACRTCDHWASQSPKLPQGMGYCRINPPVCVAVDNEVRTVWPRRPAAGPRPRLTPDLDRS